MRLRRIRTPRTSELKRNAFKHTRKEFRKNVKKSIKQVFKIIRNESKKGKTFYSLTLSDERDDYIYWLTWLAFRWVRRNTKLNVEIKEDDVVISKDGSKYVSRLFITIKWNE